jgi:hypothetical protein
VVWKYCQSTVPYGTQPSDDEADDAQVATPVTGQIYQPAEDWEKETIQMNMCVICTDHGEVVTYIRLTSFLYFPDFHPFLCWLITVRNPIHHSSFMWLWHYRSFFLSDIYNLTASLYHYARERSLLAIVVWKYCQSTVPYGTQPSDDEADDAQVATDK